MKKMVKKQIALALFGLICICAAFGQSQENLDTAIQRVCNEIINKLVMGPRVALVSFNSSNELSAYVLNEMTRILTRNRAATWISRQDTDRALSAANLSSSDNLSDATARQIGRTLNASFVITGILENTGGNYRIKSKMIYVSNGSVQASSDIVIADSSQLRQLLGSGNIAAAPAPVTPSQQTQAPAPVQTTPPAATQPAPVQTPAPSSTSQSSRGDPDAANWDIAVLDTAANVDYLTDIEKDVILEMNKVRTDPKKYVELYIQPRLRYFNGRNYSVPGQITLVTQEGSAAVNACITALNRASSAGVLTPERGLSRAAKDHVTDQSRTGQTGHNGSDRSTPETRMRRYGVFRGSWTLGENIAYGDATGREIVCSLLIDDGVPSRGHRDNIMNRAFTQIGVGYGTHTQYRTTCTITYAHGYTSN
ncbi:MAG: CAP domain-containing protein [Treponema sp.]|nr:CAP domain-containing protein [Treponema sp.]